MVIVLQICLAFQPIFNSSIKWKIWPARELIGTYMKCLSLSLVPGKPLRYPKRGPCWQSQSSLLVIIPNDPFWFWLLLTKVEERRGPNKQSSSVQQQYYKVGHHQKEISDYMQMETIDYGFNHVFDIVNRIDWYWTLMYPKLKSFKVKQKESNLFQFFFLIKVVLDKS